MSVHTGNTYLSAFSSERFSLTDEINKEMAGILNEIHSTKYSERFWKIILGVYINSVISRKELLSKTRLELSPLFEPINSVSHPGKKQIFIKSLRYRVKAFKTRKNYNKLISDLANNDNIAFGFHDPISVKENIGTYLPEYFPFVGKGNIEKRSKAIEIANKQESIFHYNVISQLPKIYIEHFDEIIASIPLYNPQAKILHTSIIHSFFMKFLVAKYVDNGAKLYYYQHGAYYGELINHNAHKNESSIADRFVTWGWQLTAKDLPGKAYRLEKFKRTYLASKSNISYDCLFCYPEIKSGNKDKFKEYTYLLSTKLDKSKYSRLIARPRPKGKLPFVKHKIGFPIDKDIFIDNAKNAMAVLMPSTRLVIQFTVPSTNFAECLYVDHPTVGLLNNDQPTHIIKPYYDFFLDVGVLHNNFNSLILHLNTIDLDMWWKGITEHPTYIAFKNEFLKAV